MSSYCTTTRTQCAPFLWYTAVFSIVRPALRIRKSALLIGAGPKCSFALFANIVDSIDLRRRGRLYCVTRAANYCFVFSLGIKPIKLYVTRAATLLELYCLKTVQQIALSLRH